jgi:hypothetical protein
VSACPPGCLFRRYDLQLKPVKGLPNISLSMIPGVQDFLDVVLKNILRQYIVFPHVRAAALRIPFHNIRHRTLLSTIPRNGTRV